MAKYIKSNKILKGLSMTLLSSIHAVFVKHEQPMNDKKIEEVLRNDKKYKDKPTQFISQIRARLYTDIKNNSDTSFAILAPNTFGLKIWVEEKSYKNYEPTVKSPHKSHLDEVIAVFPKEKIDDLLSSPGLSFMDLPLTWLQKNCMPMVRGDAEKSLEYIQLVSSFIISSDRNVFAHVRSGRAPEGRLKGEKSVLLGGHIEFDEIMQLSNVGNYDLFEETLLLTRELDEEVSVVEQKAIEFIGCMYDSSREVSSQHLSLLHHVKLPSEQISVKEKGYHINPEWIHIKKATSELSSFENWSAEVLTKFKRI